MHQAPVRLSKFLADAGIASRRKADIIIASGRVKVNNVKVITSFFKVIPDEDTVTVDDKAVQLHSPMKYIALFKPVGYLSDLMDKRDRKLARELVSDKERLFPIGRLDYHSEGLMLFTSDGAFAQRIMHPRYEVEKEYLAKVKGKLGTEEIRRAVDGVLLDGARYAFDDVRLMRSEKENSWYRIVIHEGRNRMIRKLAHALGHPVIKLRRVRIGPIHLGRMLPGEYRYLSAKEIAAFTAD